MSAKFSPGPTNAQHNLSKGLFICLTKYVVTFSKVTFRGLSQNFGAIILATYFGNLFWHAKLWQLFVKKNGNLFWHAKLWQEKWQLIFWHAKFWQLNFGKKNGNLFWHTKLWQLNFGI